MQAWSSGMTLNVLLNSRAFYIFYYHTLLYIILFSQKQEQGEGNIDVRLCLQPNNQEHMNKACSFESTLVESGEYLKNGPLKSGFTFYLKVYGTAIFSSV